MNTVYFKDGGHVELPDVEMLNLLKKMKNMGVRMHQTRYTDPQFVVILSESGISRIVMGEDDDIGQDDGHITDGSGDVEEHVHEKEAEDRVDEVSDAGESDKETPKPEPKKETQDERNARLLAEMKKKSDCSNSKDHMGHKQIIYKQQVTMKKKGAKRHVTSTRYFPVCSFCGLKQRYVKADSLTDEQKENALIWTGVTGV